MKIRRILTSAAFVCAAILSMGAEECDKEDVDMLLDPEAFEEAQKPAKAVVSVHEIVKYQRAERVEQKIETYFGVGEQVCVNRNPLIYSKEIKKITAVLRKGEPGYYDLTLQLTDRGRKMWIGLSNLYKGVPVAFVIDGVYYRSFKPRMIYDGDTNEVTVDGPFDQATAFELQNNSEINYKKKNK